jgi:microcystin degradation protein MlrC
MRKAFRVAIGSIFTECNHFVDTLIDVRHFERNELRRGDEVLDAEGGVVGGMLGVLRERGTDIVPLIVATAVSGGPLAAECYRQLKEELLGFLRQALPVDGVLLPLHGSATSVDVDDLEGDLLGAVRELVGTQVPVIATLDCHAHVTREMIRHANALLAWETYPHVDTFMTGVRGARLLFDTLEGKIKPTMAIAKVPVLASGVNGQTDVPGPFADVMSFAKSREGHEGVLSTSVFLVHPYLDLPDMGAGGLVITDLDIDKAVALASEIAQKYWDRRFDLDPPVYTPADAIHRGLQVHGGRILLVETADCCGGGAAGDSVATLNSLLEADIPYLSLVPVLDPEAAAQCHALGAGHEIQLKLGHKLDPKWGKPIAVSGKILKTSDGAFKYSGGVWEGQWSSMGPSATLQVGSTQVLISSYPTYDWADEQFRSMDLDTRAAKFIVVKNPMNHRLGYGGIYKERFILDTPGPTPATLLHLSYRRLSRPVYPFDKYIPNLSPTILRHDQ